MAMSCLYPCLFAGISVIYIYGTPASSSWLELNPTLGKYQDADQCFPLVETWYTVYTNYEWDPVLGGTGNCFKDFETGPPVNGRFPVTFESGNQSVQTTVTLESSDGYTTKNIVKILPLEGNETQEAYVGYLNCKKCLLLRNVNVNGSFCALRVPESELGHHATCCDFIFDLLCGATPKFLCKYDDSCSTQN